MKKLEHFGMAAISAMMFACVLALPASAQGTANVQKPFSVKLGVIFPSSGTAQNFGGDTQFSVGLDDALSKTNSSTPVLPSIYLDYVGGSQNGGHINSTGIGVAIRSYSSNINSGNQTPYFGAGVGVYDTNGERAGGTSNTDVNFGGKVFVGDEIGNSFFLEGSYHFLPSSRGINPSGFGVQVGFRF